MQHTADTALHTPSNAAALWAARSDMFDAFDAMVASTEAEKVEIGRAVSSLWTGLHSSGVAPSEIQYRAEFMEARAREIAAVARAEAAIEARDLFADRFSIGNIS